MEPMNRRHFLATTTAMALSGAVYSGPAAEGAVEAYPIGCYTRPFDQHEFRVALDAIAEAGYRYAGIMTAKGTSWVIVSPKTKIEEAATIGDEVTKRGLKTISVY